ncbi:hypothetical protein BDF21DRAFT_409107 [Thamnidium elegans]|uniref:Uncharacterized protein n=1 Tax=Thamnidium elegans TaxID=101142 RepID=A0A8H7VXS6_9FUNG|nr:hypothetical protein INT48_001745 [Thamnidium elegans]KAI8094609.1 hypothetical protein BDF21DRAFT_409107 [Thamnidium elegans]
MLQRYFFISVILLTLLQLAKAQLGPKVLSPIQNATVDPGSKVDIVYEYQNLGTGDYSIDIQLWQDAAVTIPVSDVVINEPITAGNSSGIKVAFTLNSTYTWKVPRGLNSTFWLTVTGNTRTALYKDGVNLRSRPVMLHTSAANLMSKPASVVILLLASVITLALF